MENKKINLIKKCFETCGHYKFYSNNRFNDPMKALQTKRRYMNCSDIEYDIGKVMQRILIMKMIYDNDFEVRRVELDSEDCVLKLEIGLKERFK